MGFGRELKDFSAGFQVGHRAGMDRRKMKLDEYRYGEPDPDKVNATDTPLDDGGGGAIPTVPGTDSTETGSTGTPTAQSGVNDVDTAEVAGRLKHDLMRDFKLNETGANGVVASLAAESGGFKMLQEIHPTVEGSRGGYGYAQWTGPRRKQFEEFASTNKLDPKSYEANYGFLKQELQGPEGRWLNGLNEAKDAREATQLFTGSAAEKRGFLRPGKPNMSGRFTWADKIAGIKPLDFGSPATKPKDGFDKVKAGGEALAEGFGDEAPAEEEEKPVETAEAIPVPEDTAGDLSDWTQFASLDTGGLSDPRDQQAQPAMFAATGGVIPEPTQMFAGGGVTTSRTLNPEILAARAAGKAPTSTDSSMAAARSHGMAGGNWTPSAGGAVGGKGGFTPRRVGDPGANAVGYEPMKMVNGLTPTQLALHQSRDKRAASEAAAAKAQAAAAAKAAAAQPKQQPGVPSFEDWKNYTLTGRQPGQIGMSRGGNAKIMQKAQTPEGQAMLQQQYDKMYGAGGDTEAQKRERTKWGARNLMFGTGLFAEEGGVIPDPSEEFVPSYKRGGVVEGRDATFQRLLKEETRVGSRDQQGARDRAARRLSALEGRPSSTAYKAGGDDGYFTPRKPKSPKAPPVDKIETGATPGPSHTDEHERDTSLTPKDTKHDTEHERDTSLDNDNEVRVPMAPALEGTPDELKRKAAGTPTAGYDEDGAIPVPDAPDTGFRKSPQAPKSRTGEPMPDPDEPVKSDTSRARPTSPAGPKGQPIPPARRIIPTPEPEPIREPGRYTRPRLDLGVLEPEPAIPEREPDVSLAPAQPPLPQPDPTQADPAVAPPNVPLRPQQGPPAPPEAVREPGRYTLPKVGGGPEAPEAGFQPAPHSTLPPEMSQAVSIAKQALAQGAPAQEVLASLRKYGVPIDALPAEMQSQLLGFEEGGAIPEAGWSFADGGAVPEQGERGYNEAVAMGQTARQPLAEEQEFDDVQATPKLRNDVAVGLDGGIKYLTRAFGLDGGGGGIPEQDGGAGQEQGIKRLASGEGAATQEEIQGIDDKVDPDRRLNEGDRNMVRIAKTVQWYLQNGRKDDAEAAAASLMQYGAQRMGKLGSMAGAAYNTYQQSGDPKDLDNTIKFLEKAYEMIPDGANINIQLNESTGKLETTHTDADGDVTTHEVDPTQLPGLLQQVQQGSAYWNSIYKLADPEGYRSDLSEKRTIASEGRAEQRETEKNKREKEEEIERNDREKKEEGERNDRELKEAEDLRLKTKKEKDEADEAERKRKADEKKVADAEKNVDWDKINPLKAAADRAKEAVTAAGDDAAKAKTAQDAYNETLSRLQDALPPEIDRAAWIGAQGHDKELWTYTEELKPLPPEALKRHPGARRGKWPDGRPGWFYTGADGKPRDATK